MGWISWKGPYRRSVPLQAIIPFISLYFLVWKHLLHLLDDLLLLDDLFPYPEQDGFNLGHYLTDKRILGGYW